jgi:hypothetical protein
MSSRILPTSNIKLGSLTLPTPDAGDVMEIILLYFLQDTGTGCDFVDSLSDYTASNFTPLKDLNLGLPTWVCLHRDTKTGLKLGRLRI